MTRTTPLSNKISKSNDGPSHILSFESFGVRIRITSSSDEVLSLCREMVTEAFPDYVTFLADVGADVDHHFKLDGEVNGNWSLYMDGQPLALRRSREIVLDMLMPRLRLTVAENAKGFVFVHAGVVSWKGKAIMIPGFSMQGKTTLVAEFIGRGATYYSDEYAILDADGTVYPFLKSLSVRGSGDLYRQRDVPISHFKGRSGQQKVDVGLVVITWYEPNGNFRPEILSPSVGIVELIQSTIPIRKEPAFVLSVLSVLAERSVFVRSRRGEARQAVDKLLELLESQEDGA